MPSRKIGALWLRKTNDGKTYMSGILNDLSADISIAVFKNDRKEKDNQPDYNIVLSEKKETSKPRTENDSFFGNDTTVTDTHEPAADQEEIDVDKIPF
jgi:uncharacterized protein (DUF736 family)